MQDRLKKLQQDLETLHGSTKDVLLELKDILDDVEAEEVPVEKVEAVQPKGAFEGRVLRLGIVVGHTRKDGGAVAVEGTIPQEYAYNTKLAQDMLNIAANREGLIVRVFYRDDIGIRGAYKLSDAWGANCTIELHYNAAANPKATGTETLHSGTKRSKSLAKHVQKRMVKALNLRDRGLKDRSTGRGSTSLRAGRAPAIIVEPGFGSNFNDAKTLLRKRRELAQAYIEGAADWWNFDQRG